MSFEKASSRVPTSIGSVQVTLIDNADGTKQVNYFVQILDANGSEMRVRGDIGDLEPQLTAAQKSGLADFMDAMRAKAEAEFL